jgi:copper chaperone CopZ
MKPLLLALIATALTAAAAEKKEFVPHPVTQTFYISGVECGACVDAISQSVSRVKSVTAVKMDPADGYANISFDTHVSSAHQIAQAIADAAPVHGKPYAATLKMSVPAYAQDGNAAKVDAVFAKRAEWVKVETADKAKGAFVIHFLPLKVDKAKTTPQGWNPGHFGHPVHDPAPKGLGLAFALVKEGQPAPAAAKKAAKKK